MLDKPLGLQADCENRVKKAIFNALRYSDLHLIGKIIKPAISLFKFNRHGIFLKKQNEKKMTGFNFGNMSLFLFTCKA